VSGADRTAKWREKQKNKAGVTKRDERDVTRVTGDVTRDAVTTDKKREEEKREESMSGKPDDPALAFAEKAVALINAHAGTKYRPTSDAILKLCRTLIRNKHTLEQAEQVIASKRAWVGDPKMGQYFRPGTLLAAKNFATYLDDLEASGSSDRPIRQTAPRSEAVHPMMQFLDFDEDHDEEAANVVAS
jgi:uncharacterized phage protein (TIGR02220 family)